MKMGADKLKKHFIEVKT